MKKVAGVAVLLGVLLAASAPAFAQAGAVPAGEQNLGTVSLGRKVMADGKVLAAGTYQVRLTAQAAQPAAKGASEGLERWVEFLQAGKVKGREVVSIVAGDEIKTVAKMSPPARGTSRVEMLKGNDYLRVWINRGGVHYLIHLPPAA